MIRQFLSFLPSLVFSLFVGSLANAGSSSVSYDAAVEPAESLRLVLDVSGVVESVSAVEGQWVEEGSELLRLRAKIEEIRSENASLRLANESEKLAELERRQARLKTLWEDGLVSDDQWSDLTLRLLEARGALAAAERDLALAREEMNLRILRAPVEGHVFRVSRSPGEGVRPLDVLVDLMDVSSLRAHFFLPAEWVGRFQPGDVVTLWWEGSEKKSESLDGVVDTVDPFVDPATGVLRLNVRLESGSEVQPGDLIRFKPDKNS